MREHQQEFFTLVAKFAVDTSLPAAEAAMRTTMRKSWAFFQEIDDGARDLLICNVLSTSGSRMRVKGEPFVLAVVEAVLSLTCINGRA